MPDVAKAKLAAQRLYTLLHSPEGMQGAPSVSGDTGGNAKAIEGRVEFRDVRFTYPARADAEVLKGLNLTVEPGKTMALVGSSGCGKSTIIALLERYYEPTGGNILVDGMPIQGD